MQGRVKTLAWCVMCVFKTQQINWAHQMCGAACGGGFADGVVGRSWLRFVLGAYIEIEQVVCVLFCVLILPPNIRFYWLFGAL